jgi:tetratricopeptide (TPR) repeat protein
VQVQLLCRFADPADRSVRPWHEDVIGSRFSRDPSRAMSESSEPGRPLHMKELRPEHGYTAAVRPPRRWIRRSILAILVIAVGLLAVFLVRPSGGLDCKTASRTASDGVAVTVCQQEYQQTRSPLIGTYLADALRRSGNGEAAQALANDLLSTDVRADALQILAKIATSQDRTDDAIKLLEEARRLHRQQGNHVELARDDQALSTILQVRQQYAEALQTIDEGISEARAGGDTRIEGYSHLFAARLLTRVGYFEAAHQELDRAAPQMPGDREQAELWRLRGDLEQEVGRDPRRPSHDKQAVAAFERSLEYARRVQLTATLIPLHLNLVYSLAELGRTDEAEHHLEDAGVLDQAGDYKKLRQQAAAQIAYRRGNYSLATSLNEQVYPNLKNIDNRIDICVRQARIALAANDLAAAVTWAKRGVENAEEVRAAQTLAELRPWVLATRREPFELLFTAYARSARVEEAILVFDQWQGRTLLDEMARPSQDPSPTLSHTASQVQSLGRWLPSVSRAPLMSTDGGTVLQTLRTIDLVGLAVADGRVWRVTAVRGRFTIDELGSFDKLRDPLDGFQAAPTDAARADELGKLIVPDNVVRKTGDALYVVLDAPFAALPFAALRRNGQPLIAVRPVLRAPRFPSPVACEQHPEKPTALVLADAAGDLPDARRESSKVAALFGTTPLVGPAATSTALFAAKSDPLLHVAVHAEVDAGGGALKLHDRAVSAAEISANQLGPALVVLSACSTARAWDPEIAGSLSTAFLAGGSERVIATLRPVSDAGALELTSRFYSERGADGPDGPVRVLARIQAELALTDNKEWPNFAVFGVCQRRS